MSGVLAVAAKELRCIARGKLLLLVLFQPLIYSAVWGYCCAIELAEVPVAVADDARDAHSRALLRALKASGAFSPFEVDSRAAAEEALVTGRAGLSLSIARSPARARRHAPPSLQLLADGSDPVVSTLGRIEVEQILAAAGGQQRPGALRLWFNASLRSADTLLLNAIAYNLTWFLVYAAAAFLRERDAGTIAALQATPLTPLALWLGNLLADGAVALWGTLVQLGLTLLVVGVPFRGEPLPLMVGLALFIVTNLNLGYAMALVARRGAYRMVLGLLFALVSICFSGFLVALSSLPPWAREVARLLPLTHGVALLRSSVLRGAGFAGLLPELWALAAFALATGALAWWSARALLQPER